MLQSQHHFSFPPLSHSHKPSPLLTSPSLHFPHRPFSLHSLSSHQFPTRPGPGPCLAQLTESTTTTTTATTPSDDGPIELPPSNSIFATTDEPSTLQVATSLLLTGAISVFLFRSLRRRAKRAKELKFRSTGAKKSLKEEAIENLKAMAPTSDAKSPPSAVQALLGGISAAVIALILYKFTAVEKIVPKISFQIF